MNDTKITMKSLARQKADVRAKIARQHSELSQTYWDTLALFEGAVTSLRMIRKVRSLFRK